MNKIKTQIEFLFLQIEMLDELSFQFFSPKSRETQIRTMVFTTSMIMIRTSAEKVSYGSLEHCTDLVDKIVKRLYPAIANGINNAQIIKQNTGKFGHPATQDRLEKNIASVVDLCYNELLEVFALPQNLPAVMLTGKGGHA